MHHPPWHWQGSCFPRRGVGGVVPQVAASATTYLWVQGCPSLPSAQGVLGWFHKLQGGELGLRLEIILELGK